MSPEMVQALAELEMAITNEGPNPDRHRSVMATHRHEWPTLWAAIDKLRKAPLE